MDGRCSASVGEEVWQGEVEAAALARPSRLASTRSWEAGVGSSLSAQLKENTSYVPIRSTQPHRVVRV